ncbi:hypothetical protein C41B8_14160 [Salinisphaera hydrothermalis C41B8]|uniref:Uncharacterized protein n=1 Tax=Salinisphaera hydrothermalis (strain C41B8) TaxID=1304275 RepID=A0A084IIN2_SALHC|nr:hypothetical protein C41B8_14160 [Salinisphaera hydrothermalis C41B8]
MYQAQNRDQLLSAEAFEAASSLATEVSMDPGKSNIDTGVRTLRGMMRVSAIPVTVSAASRNIPPALALGGEAFA